jgi:GNAT superfamily N-acetyltransferase
MIERSPLYVIEEVTGVDSPHLPGMGHWLDQVFPEYAPPRFEKFLTRLRHGDGRHEIQLFIGRIEDQVAGLVQVFFREWHQGLMADIDLLGVLEPYRRSGLGSALVKQAILATQDMALAYGRPAVGVVSLADPHYAPVIQLHRSLGGQIRADYVYPSGDIVVWYPLQEDFAAVETPVLAQQLREFGRTLESVLVDDNEMKGS